MLVLHLWFRRGREGERSGSEERSGRWVVEEEEWKGGVRDWGRVIREIEERSKKEWRAGDELEKYRREE